MLYLCVIMRIDILISAITSLVLTACSAGANDSAASGTDTASVSQATPATVAVEMPQFNADSAFNYVKAQVDFGVRVPGTESHRRCATYLAGELKRHGADSVVEQKTTVTAFNGDRLPINNIMGRYNLDADKRILLLAHWDTRPWAECDPDNSMREKPIPGANDGASGVGVLLEIARQLGEKRPDIGVDILFVDAEDYGTSEGEMSTDSWALGTQYWVKNMPYKAGAYPMYGILLDMVGGKNAMFHREQYSHYYATQVVDKVWGNAAKTGHDKRFVNQLGGGVTDDHYFIITQAGIPCIDIIENQNPLTGSFNPTWHTHADNIDNIDAATLKAVGDVVLYTIYNEK